MLTYDPEDTYWNCVCLLLPAGKATLVDTGVFEEYGERPWRVMGNDTVFYNQRYTVIANPTAWKRNQRTKVKHRFVSLPRLVVGAPYNRHVDHKNRVRMDNRATNLRVATPSQNAMNRSGGKKKASRFKGVHRGKKGRWLAKVTYEGNQYHLGTFTEEVEAALAYNAFIKAHCPEFGYLNPITGAKAEDEPTASKQPPAKRRSRLVKLTPKEQRLRKLHSKMERARRTREREQRRQAEVLAAKEPWQPVDSPWPSDMRLSDLCKAVSLAG